VREGILGGSFDPIHNAHLHVAREARRRLALDRVLFVPARVPPHKPVAAATSAERRLAMVKLAIAGEPGFEVSDVELRREGPSYTIDTVRSELDRLGADAEIFFLVGTDQALELDTWRRIDDLARLCTLVPVARPGFHLADLDRLARKLPAELAARIKSAALDTAPMDVSSTDIRRRVREGQSIADLVPPAVARYIREHGLYR
jgi:nicotinate-nucleotide adenylyltransferase